MGGPNLYCEEHGEGIKLYCKTHGVALCYFCAMIDHHEQSCVCQDIHVEGAIVESEANLNDLGEKAMEKLEMCQVYGDQMYKCRSDVDTPLQALKDKVDSVINETINQEIDDKNQKLQEEIQKMNDEIQQINDKIQNNDKAREKRLELNRAKAEKRRAPVDNKAKPNDLNEKASDKLKSCRDYQNRQCREDTDTHLQALKDEFESLIIEAIQTSNDREKEDTAKINQAIDDKYRKLQEEIQQINDKIQQINDEIQNNDKAREKRLELNRTKAEKRRAPVDNKQHGLKTDITQIYVEKDRKIGELEKSWEGNTITSSGPNTECAFGQSSRRPSTGGEVKAAFSNKSIDHERTSSYDVATNDTTKPSPLIMTKLSFNFCICAFTLLLVSSVVAGEDIHVNIDCRGDVSFTSPNYPSNYPDDAHTKWVITAPEGRRILVTFTDFNVETDDFLYVADKVDTQNSMRYTGEQMQFPPFLTKGNELKMTFISVSSRTRKGFNVSSSCYTNSREANQARIVGGNSPGKGFLELPTRSDDWRRVCKDGFDERMAEVVCGELGYPAVRKVSYGTDDFKSDGQDYIKAPICNDYTYRLEDCSWSSGNCTSADAVKVECYEPGFKGCYDPEYLPQQNGFSFESTSQCVSACRAITRVALAMMIGTQCFCSTADEVNLPNIPPATCNKPTQDSRRVNNSFVYDVSVGFCDELDDVIHGSCDSNITWFGFIVRFACDDGYSLNGGGTVQCVPGRSPYYPVWNGSVPTCEMSGDGTSTSSPSTTLNPEVTLNPGGTRADLLPLYIVTGIFSLVLIVCGVVICCNRQRLREMYNKSREAAGTGHRRKRTTRKN